MGYIDGYWPDAVALGAAHPGATLIRITTNPAHNDGDMLDVETGDATPAQAPGWVVRRRAAGHQGPLVYFAESFRSQVIGEFIKQGVRLPGLFSAAYPGIGPVIPPGDVGHQWIDRGAYDESVVVDFLPGIDPVPTPPSPSPSSTQESNMLASTPSGNGYWIVHPDGSIWAFGDAQYLGGCNVGAPVAGGAFAAGEIAITITAHPGGAGYWILSSHGHVYSFGAAGYHGAA